MRRIFIFALLTVVSCSVFASGSRSEQLLVDLYKKYHQEQNLADMMSLFYQDGTPEFILTVHEKSISDFFDLTIKSVNTQAVPIEKQTKFKKGIPYKDKTIVANLEPLKEMIVEFNTEDQGKAKIENLTFMIGKKGDTYYFVMSKFKEVE